MSALITAVDISHEFPRLAPALEMHNVQVLEKFVEIYCVQEVSKSCKKCFVSKSVLQNSYVIVSKFV